MLRRCLNGSIWPHDNVLIARSIAGPSSAWERVDRGLYVQRDQVEYRSFLSLSLDFHPMSALDVAAPHRLGPLCAISGHQLRLKHLPIIGNDLCFQMLFRKRLVTSHAFFVGNDLWDPTHHRGRLHCRFNGNCGGRSRPAPSTDSELGCGRGSATRVH